MTKEEWQTKAYNCPVGTGKVHSYIPIAFKNSGVNEHVSMLMCTKCFHEVNIKEAFEHRIKL